jgi:hypothetical protein
MSPNATRGGPTKAILTGGLRSWRGKMRRMKIRRRPTWPTEFSAVQVYSPWSSYCRLERGNREGAGEQAEDEGRKD